MPPGSPNVLWICMDQQRRDTLGCYGNEFVETPAIDGLAAEGVQYDRAFCQHPVCTPSRASFLTGRYPRTCRVRQNGQPIPEEETLVTRQFADAGYRCGLAGKLHVSPCSPASPYWEGTERRIDDGYAAFHFSHAPGHDVTTNEYRRWLDDRGVEYDPPMAPEHHQTTWCADRTISFVEDVADREEPWLFSVNPFDPHPPRDPPESYVSRYESFLEEIPLPNYEPGELADKPTFQGELVNEGRFKFGNDFLECSPEEHRRRRAAYWAMVDLLDDQVARILDALDRTGQREDTLVVFMSDHGTMLGDHGFYGKGPYLYEPALRVPLIFSWPDGVESGIETDALVELVDVAPTLLDAAGIDHDPGMQGQSLWPALAGEDDVDDHRDSIYAEHYNGSWRPGLLDDGDRVVAEDYEPVYETTIRTDRYKLVRVHGDGGELYDLHDDPTETHNRWDDPGYADIRAELMAKLSDRMAHTVDPLPERYTRY